MAIITTLTEKSHSDLKISKEIEAKMHEIIKRDKPFTKDQWSRKDAKAFFKEQGEDYKVELVDMIPEGEDIKIYRQGDWLGSMPWPTYDFDR